MPVHDFKSQRLFVDAPMASGAAVELDRGQAHYLISVLRMKDGAGIRVFNGRDGEWQAVLSMTGRKSGALQLVEQTRPQPPAADLVYCFAPLKQARLDYMVQKAVEMGAGALQPVLTQYTQNQRINLERMRANAIEAAEQCSILSVPECREAVPLDALLSGWEKDRALIVADEAAEENNPLAPLARLRGRPLGLLIGPEGGFSGSERETIAAMAQAVTISLGPRILRADTAAVAALTVLQAACGDW
ncbi:MAG: 16S rRNA (uracil(1498)-N(3))-methyltransferase [Nitratireductor sp.]|nr:16S rRNA (uracil(1498)-N(3))-methyltransferase [Nitratireductor sp.]